MPLPVSVIIPAYNAAATLPKTIESLLKQTYSNWQAIIVDDGSVDTTPDIIKQYAVTDDRIIYIQQPNAGVSAARNSGIEAATYDWLLFLDADDYIAEQHLEILTGVIKENPTADIIHGGWSRVTENGTPIQETRGYTLDHPFAVLAVRCPFAIHACVVRKSKVIDVGLFDKTLRTCEDWDLWQRLARIGATFIAVPGIYAYYYVHAGSLYSNTIQFYNDAQRVLQQAYAPDERLQSASQQVLPQDSYLKNKYYLDSWVAGLLLGSGKDIVSIINWEAAGVAFDLEPYWVAQNIYEAAKLMIMEGQAHWPTLYATVENNLYHYLSTLENVTKAPYLSRRTQQLIEQQIIKGHGTSNPIIIGITYATTIEITAPVQDIVIGQNNVERSYIQVVMEGEALGSIELPVFDHFVSVAVIKDAIAATFAWAILLRYFQHTVWKTEAITDSHQEEAWTLFLQQVWNAPGISADRFYDAVNDNEPPYGTMPCQGVAILEVSNDLPQLTTELHEVNLVITVGGSAIGMIPLKADNNNITASTIRAAVTTWSGFELCRTVVREALIGSSLKEPATIKKRLQTAAKNVAAFNLSDSYFIPGISKDHNGRRALFIGNKELTIGTAVSRYAQLPHQAAADIIALAKENDNPVWQPAGIAAAAIEQIFYQPSFLMLSGQQRLPTTTQSKEVSATPAYGRAHFEKLFTSQPDPWKYTNRYEQTKYELTLSLLPKKAIAQALEIACAEGHFTIQLAPHVQQLLATDISQVALQRAADRCAAFTNIHYQQFDLVKDEIRGKYDLIFCSEVLYYMGSKEILALVAKKIAQALKPGGSLIMAHAHQIIDEPDKPGFDWGLAYGAKGISDVFSSLPQLQLAKEIKTPLYRIQRFERSTSFSILSKKISTERVEIDQPAPIPPSVASSVRWQGGEPFMEQVEPEVTRQLPILMYHRIAPSGSAQMIRYRLTPDAFEEQLQYLKDSGYYSTTPDEWVMAILYKKPLPGKAICLTFDDGYTDFYEYAWPLLKRYGFTATVFLVTDQVGNSNSWDHMYHDPVPLMNWDVITQLQKEGVTFGSHTASHPMLAAITPAEMVQQGLQSKLAIQQHLGFPVSSIAYPYGSTDAVVAHIMGACGYTIGLSCEQKVSTFNDNPLLLPRLEIEGNYTLENFIRKIKV